MPPMTWETLLFFFLLAFVIHAGWVLGGWLMGGILRAISSIRIGGNKKE